MNIALGVEYSGSNYCGWQRQSHFPSVQQTLEEVLAEIADHPVKINCAGRTDTGVHATGQVVNFQLHNQRPLRAWNQGANTYLPDDISIRWAQPVDSTFHARHSALQRRYRYVIFNASYPSATLSKRVSWYPQKLDEKNMHSAAQALLGEQDFASFQAASCQSETSYRCVKLVSIWRWMDFVIIDISANAFLHHMVRNIVGSLLAVGCGRQSVDFIGEVLQKKDRTQAATTAKPEGLYLVRVDYPSKYQIPRLPLGPFSLADNVAC